MTLAAEGLTVSYGERAVLHDLDLSIVDNEVTAVVGPNGCGKSTLLRTLGRLLSPDRGRIVLDGRRIDRLPTREVARRLGLLPQTPAAPGGMTVRELVSRGRNPHLSWLHRFGVDDTNAVAEALAAVGLTDSADRAVDELSGGQRQRAWIAMVLAQRTDLLLLDEPTTFLDLAHQVEVLDLVASLHAEHGRTVVMVLHDLNLAARYAGHLVLVADGRIAAQGPPADVLTPDAIERVFGLRATVLTDPHTGGPLIVPRPTSLTPQRFRPQGKS